jgi:hypothetical protein
MPIWPGTPSPKVIQFVRVRDISPCIPSTTRQPVQLAARPTALASESSYPILSKLPRRRISPSSSRSVARSGLRCTDSIPAPALDWPLSCHLVLGGQSTPARHALREASPMYAHRVTVSWCGHVRPAVGRNVFGRFRSGLARSLVLSAALAVTGCCTWCGSQPCQHAGHTRCAAIGLEPISRCSDPRNVGACAGPFPGQEPYTVSGRFCLLPVPSRSVFGPLPHWSDWPHEAPPEQLPAASALPPDQPARGVNPVSP